MLSTSKIAFDVICPATVTFPLEIKVSTATLEFSSCSKQASKILSEIKSHTLSGCPSVTLSDVKKYLL